MRFVLLVTCSESNGRVNEGAVAHLCVSRVPDLDIPGPKHLEPAARSSEQLQTPQERSIPSPRLRNHIRGGSGAELRR